MAEPGIWRRCSACKGPIGLRAPYWACNVSTCNRKRTALAFCSVNCWEVHLSSVNHRESWAVEKQAPAVPDTSDAGPGPPVVRERKRTIARPPQPPSRTDRSPPPDDVLLIASRLKSYVRAKSGGFNTSDGVLEPLSHRVRRICDEAIENARREGRMTVLDRDIPEG